MTAVADWAPLLSREPPVLVTGAAGFIGFHVARRLLDAGVSVIGFDNLNDYYDPRLKQARLADLETRPGFHFVKGDLADRTALRRAMDAGPPKRVAHLAAQAGVRYSIENPHAYGDANLTGFLNILEECRRVAVDHLVFASSSSVYGGNRTLPFSTHHGVDHPVSLYAATKKANELMAHAYAHLYGLPTTGLRFFTVYGPWGRPDMAYWLFADAIQADRPITVYNDGKMARDFTYIDDITEAITRLLPMSPEPNPHFDATAPDPATSWAPYRIYNIGNHRREQLTTLINLLEHALGKPARKIYKPMQKGDVVETWADVAALEAAVGYRPDTSLEQGIASFVHWFQDWNKNL